MALPDLDFNYKQFMNKTTVIYGESGTGKSFIITDILKLLSDHIDQIIVFSPTDRQNNTYSRGLVPLPCIHYDITAELMCNIWERQEALTNVYSMASDIRVLERLFNRIPAIEHVKDLLRSMENKLSTYREDLELAGETDVDIKYAEMKAECDRMILSTYKKYIAENMSYLCNEALANDEKCAIKYLNLNPRIVLIFDDCTDLLKKFNKNIHMQKLFFQGRHVNITTIIACHTDVALPPDLKKNAFVSIYTTPGCAQGYFQRNSSNIDKEGKAKSLYACKSAFSVKHQKLVFIRETNGFYKFIAQHNDGFKFGSKYIWEFCKNIENEKKYDNNRYMSSFLN